MNIITLSLILTISARASHAEEPCDSSFFDRERIQKLIEQKKIETISGILNETPDCIKQGQVQIFSSSSLQCATAKAPRIILYVNDDQKGDPQNERSRSMCSFNSGNKEDYAEFYKKNPQADCHENSMECQTFNRKTKGFEYFEIKVPKDDSGAYFSNVKRNSDKHSQVTTVNPAQCMTSCHRANLNSPFGPDPRPNIENYPNWPGFYGSFHDKLDAVPQEKENYFKQFVPYQKTNARYRSLPLMRNENGKVISNRSHKPTVDLQNVLESQNYERIAAQLTSDKMHDKVWPYRYALLGAIACNDWLRTVDKDGHRTEDAARKYPIESFIPPVLAESFTDTYQDFAASALIQHQKNIENLALQQKGMGQAAFDQFDKQYDQDMKIDPKLPISTYNLDNDHGFFDATRLSYLAKNLGFNTENWSMTFKKTHDFEAGAENTRNLLPLMAEKFIDPIEDKDLHLNLETYMSPPIDTRQCDLLREKSLKALNNAIKDKQIVCKKTNSLSPIPEKQSAEISQVILADKNLKSAQENFALCLNCHTSGAAKYIPFDKPDELKKLLQNGTLMDEIKNRIDSGSMPKKTILNSTEREQLKDYFNTLK